MLQKKQLFFDAEYATIKSTLWIPAEKELSARRRTNAMLLRLNDINKFYHGNQVLSHVSLTVEDQDRIGLVGVNGCGKSTLLRILTGQELPDHIGTSCWHLSAWAAC